MILKLLIQDLSQNNKKQKDLFQNNKKQMFKIIQYFKYKNHITTKNNYRYKNKIIFPPKI